MKAVNTRAVRFGRADQGYAMALTLYRPKKKGGTVCKSTDTDVVGNRKYGQWPLRRDIADITAADLEGFRLAVLQHHGQIREKRSSRICVGSMLVQLLLTRRISSADLVGTWAVGGWYGREG